MNAPGWHGPGWQASGRAMFDQVLPGEAGKANTSIMQAVMA
jgi:hypothetical protein